MSVLSKMDFGVSFITGIACGVCMCTLYFKRNFFSKTLPAAIKVSNNDEYKLVLVVRNDLKMGKGKIAAQCAHAAVGAYAKALKSSPEVLKEWEYTGQAKVAVKVETEEELMEVYKNANKAKLTTSLIRDAGRTQIAANSKTVLGIGPAPKSQIDLITGHLKLL